MRNILNLLFNPKGTISGHVYILGIGISVILFVILSGFVLALRFLDLFQGGPNTFAFGIVFVSFIYQISIMTAKRLKDIGVFVFLKNTAKRLINILITLAGFGVIIGFLSLFALIWQAFHIPEIITTDGDALKIIECTSPFGSWFNRNELTIRPEGFFYEKKGVLSKTSLSVPYSKVKRVTFIRGTFWNTITITTTNFSLFKDEIYILSGSNFEEIKRDIQTVAGGSIIIEERKSLTRQALHPFSR